MEILKFKTNISGRAEISRVAPFLDKLENIKNWQIDSKTEENILSISGDNVNPQQIQNTIKEAGFESDMIRVLGISGDEM